MILGVSSQYDRGKNPDRPHICLKTSLGATWSHYFGKGTFYYAYRTEYVPVKEAATRYAKYSACFVG